MLQHQCSDFSAWRVQALNLAVAGMRSLELSLGALVQATLITGGNRVVCDECSAAAGGATVKQVATLPPCLPNLSFSAWNLFRTPPAARGVTVKLLRQKAGRGAGSRP